MKKMISLKLEHHKRHLQLIITEAVILHVIFFWEVFCMFYDEATGHWAVKPSEHLHRQMYQLPYFYSKNVTLASLIVNAFVECDTVETVFLVL